MAVTAPLPVLTIDQQEAPTVNPIVGVSATLAANEALAERRRRGERVLPLAFGEAGVPVAPVLRDALATASFQNGYGPVAGSADLRAAVAGYWTRRGLPTAPGDVVGGPGSKALLFGLLLGLHGVDVAIPRPSWVSYAAQAALTGVRPVHVPIADGAGGVPDPDLLSGAVTTARRAGRRIGAVIVTLPDNPTGTLAGPDSVRQLCAVAERHDLLIISDEIYRDLTHAAAAPFLSPAEVAPERTVITAGLSKNLALGGWRLGVARLPGGAHRLRAVRDRLMGACSEIWSAPAAPVQAAAAVAFSEPPAVTERIARSRRLHGAVARAVASLLTEAGVAVQPPAGAFYLYPDFGAHHGALRRRGVTTSAELAALLLRDYGIGTLPGSEFGDPATALRLRIATSRLYGEATWQQEAALTADDPVALPWIADALDWLRQALTTVTA
jgi:aspartate aminotransferase